MHPGSHLGQLRGECDPERRNARQQYQDALHFKESVAADLTFPHSYHQQLEMAALGKWVAAAVGGVAAAVAARPLTVCLLYLSPRASSTQYPSGVCPAIPSADHTVAGAPTRGVGVLCGSLPWEPKPVTNRSPHTAGSWTSALAALLEAGQVAAVGAARAARAAWWVARRRLDYSSSQRQVAECMPYTGPGPRNSNELPKRKRTQNRRKQECIPMMMALLACYKANNYGRGKCTMEEEALTACAQNQADLERTKDTSRYHLMRLVRQMRRL